MRFLGVAVFFEAFCTAFVCDITAMFVELTFDDGWDRRSLTASSVTCGSEGLGF